VKTPTNSKDSNNNNNQQQQQQQQPQTQRPLTDPAAEAARQQLLAANAEKWLAFLRAFEPRLRESWLRTLPAHFTVAMLNAELDRRQHVLAMSNPRFVLRNWVAQRAIDAAARGDYAFVNRVLSRLENPFDEKFGVQGLANSTSAAAAAAAGGAAGGSALNSSRGGEMSEEDEAAAAELEALMNDAPHDAHTVCVSCSS
jgi:uncharacterized protein YdiU (UPF0061 family)